MTNYKPLIAIMLIAMFLLTAGLLYAGWQIRQLQMINSDWSATYQLSTHHYTTQIMVLHDKIDILEIDIQKCHDARDVYYNNFIQAQYKPPEVITEYVEVPVEIIKEVEKPVTVPMTEWRDFKCKTEFYEWYDNLIVIWFDTGKGVDCDDWSEFVWDMAYHDGYRMSEPIIHQGQYCGRRVQDNNILHIGGQVQIGNSYYYFEPNPDFDRLIYLCDRD